MYRAEIVVLRTFVASVAFVGCAALAEAAPATTGDPSAASQSTPALAVQQVRVPLLGLRDEAAMVLVGTALIGLAAAVRRAA
ncbi:MAG: hypothetical protein DMF84_04345 [Acidobacteria bacterium]|nr:MAG: hypothetical protein DMF84_04345 [Acidobacteriota bacterium]